MTPELRIVLVGRTGAGKSAVGNTILGRGEFDSRVDPIPVTKECERGSCERNGHRITVIDTPGLCNPRGPTVVIAQEIARCVGWAAPGPLAFVLVISTSYFTREEAEALRDIQTLFGEEANKFMIVLFTRTDYLERANMTLEECIEDSSPELRAVVSVCGGRYLGFNNRAEGARREQQVEALISLVQRMMRENQMRGIDDMLLSEKLKGLTRGIRCQPSNNRTGGGEQQLPVRAEISSIQRMVEDIAGVILHHIQGHRH